MVELDLYQNAGYGVLAFDQFVMEHFDFTAPPSPSADNKQWESLSRRYLALDPMGRLPYHNRGWDLEDAAPSDPRLPSQAQMKRALCPFQSIQERNSSARSTSGFFNPLWLRTCYDGALEDKYKELESRCEVSDGYSVDDADVFEDATLYNARSANKDAGGLQALLLRAPMLADVVLYSIPEDEEYYANDEPNWAPKHAELWSASQEAKWMVYIVDEEVLTVGKDLVKMMRMNLHGRCVWETRIYPGRMAGFRGALAGGGGLMMHIEDEFGALNNDNDDVSWTRGAVF